MNRVLVLLTAVAVLGGCGGPANPPTQPVTGTVTLDGQPFEGAVVTFVPSDASLRSAVATTGADGTYALTSFVTGDGAQAGSYQVKVFKYSLPEGGPSPYGDDGGAEAAKTADEIGDMTPEEEAAQMEAGYMGGGGTGRRQQRAKNALPTKYADTATSGLSYDVVEGDNVYDIPLTSK